MSEEYKHNFCCVDCTCGKTNRNFVINTTEEKANKEVFLCPNSEAELPLKLMGMELSYSSIKMTAQQQSSALKERAHLDYEKNIKERKIDMHKKSGLL